MATILVCEDKLGITSGYMEMWEAMVLRVGLLPQMFRRYSLYKSPVTSRLPVLISKGNRKSPGFNPDTEVANRVRGWFRETVRATLPQYIVIMDAALLGIFEENWDNATIDNMRGGVYQYMGATVLIMTPISAVNTKRQLKDVRAMNDGAESKEEWEETDHDPEDLYIEPYTIRSGKWVFQRDLAKLARLTGKK